MLGCGAGDDRVDVTLFADPRSVLVYILQVDVESAQALVGDSVVAGREKRVDLLAEVDAVPCLPQARAGASAVLPASAQPGRHEAALASSPSACCGASAPQIIQPGRC